MQAQERREAERREAERPQEEDECSGERERESKTQRRRTSAQARMPCSFITSLAYPPHTHTHKQEEDECSAPHLLTRRNNSDIK